MAVTAAALCLLEAGSGRAQVARSPAKDKGPRALALVAIAANGKAQLLPVTIMIGGRFYDASVYKADPVPMALESGTVYEGMQTGVSQGLFTVAGAIDSQTQGWIGDGKWETNAQIQADKARAQAEREKLAQKAPPPETEIGGPPKLRRSTPSSASPPPQASPPQSTPPGPANTGPKKAESSAPSSEPTSPPAPDRPILRRQAPSQTAQQQTKSSALTEPLKAALQYIPAISDAGGPDPRPYAYQMKPQEEQAFRDKMLAMAGNEFRSPAAPSNASAKGKPAASQFQNVDLRVFDLTNNNEPVLVLTATARIPGNELTHTITLVARDDIYGDLHKVFASMTDNQHRDVTPKYELLDAVDADGDGAGELLFRLASDAGVTYGVYRVVGDTLWPLFKGKPGS